MEDNLGLLKTTISLIKKLLAQPVKLERLRKKHPTCCFYHGVTVDSRSSINKYNAIFQNTTIIDSVIGDHTFIQKNSCVYYADIGKFCSIASRVSIGLGRHPTSYVSTHPSFYSVSQPLSKTFSKYDTFNCFERTSIGHDVWIGESALVVDGVKINTGAIIAAGAVVTKDVPAYAIVAGVPARVIKYRFSEETRERIMKTKWWDMPDAWLKKHSSLFSCPERFLDQYKV